MDQLDRQLEHYRWAMDQLLRVLHWAANPLSNGEEVNANRFVVWQEQ
jgi:hypothetical protein